MTANAFCPSPVKRILFVLFAFACVTMNSVTHAQEIEPGANSPIHFGNPDAKFKIEIFVDFQCPTCASYNESLKAVEEKYPDKIQITIRHFPLPIPAHDKAIIAARAVEAACKQAKCIEMVNLILAKQRNWATNVRARQLFTQYARKLRLDMKQYKHDFDSQETLNRIEQDYARARSLKLDSVPSVILNGKLMNYVESLDLEEIISKVK